MSYGTLLSEQMAKSLEQLYKDLEKLEGDQDQWNDLLGGYSSYSDSGNAGGYPWAKNLDNPYAVSRNAGGGSTGGGQGYASFKSSSITKQIFQPGIDVESQGLADYKDILNQTFNSTKQSQCETTMDNQTQHLANFIEATKEAIKTKEREEEASGGS